MKAVAGSALIMVDFRPCYQIFLAGGDRCGLGPLRIDARVQRNFGKQTLFEEGCVGYGYGRVPVPEPQQQHNRSQYKTDDET